MHHHGLMHTSKKGCRTQSAFPGATAIDRRYGRRIPLLYTSSAFRVHVEYEHVRKNTRSAGQVATYCSQWYHSRSFPPISQHATMKIRNKSRRHDNEPDIIWYSAVQTLSGSNVLDTSPRIVSCVATFPTQTRMACRTTVKQLVDQQNIPHFIAAAGQRIMVDASHDYDTAISSKWLSLAGLLERINSALFVAHLTIWWSLGFSVYNHHERIFDKVCSSSVNIVHNTYAISSTVTVKFCPLKIRDRDRPPGHCFTTAST